MGESDVSRDLRFGPIESSIEKYKAVLANNKELSSALNEIREKCKKEVHDLLGSKVNEYVASRQKVRDRLRRIHSVYRPTPEGEKIRNESRKKLAAEAREFIKSLGVDSDNIKKVQRKYFSQGDSAVEKAMNMNMIAAPPDAYLTSDEYSKQTSTVRGIVYRPPYDSTWGSEYREGSAGSRNVSHYENKDTGEIKCKSTMELYGASDIDYSLTDAFSEVLKWHQMTAEGYVEARFTLQCIETPYSGRVEDEFGFSHASTTQRSACYLGISQPQFPGTNPRVFVDILDYRRDSDGWDMSWAYNVAQPGERRSFRILYHPTKFPANTPLLAAIGIHDIHYAVVGDMEFDMVMTNHWRVEEVELWP